MDLHIAHGQVGVPAGGPFNVAFLKEQYGVSRSPLDTPGAIIAPGLLTPAPSQCFPQHPCDKYLEHELPARARQGQLAASQLPTTSSPPSGQST